MILNAFVFVDISVSFFFVTSVSYMMCIPAQFHRMYAFSVLVFFYGYFSCIYMLMTVARCIVDVSVQIAALSYALDVVDFYASCSLVVYLINVKTEKGMKTFELAPYEQQVMDLI